MDPRDHTVPVHSGKETASTARKLALTSLQLQQLRPHGLPPMNAHLQAGECITLSGPSGCGKTLLLRAIADLDPHEGEVLLNGVEARNIAGSQWRKRVAYVPAETHWWADTVAAHFPDEKKMPLERLGFPLEAMHWKIHRLSSGERQRLALLRALARHPSVLLLDEPTANLDPENTRRVEHAVLQFLQQGGICLWVTHDRVQQQRMGSRRWELQANGQLQMPVEKHP